jgi:hypothetical protein
MEVGTLIAIAFIPMVIWFWRHCARPMLASLRAPRAAFRIIITVTSIAVVANGLVAIAAVADVAGSTTWLVGLVGQGAWVIVVGFGYLQEYRFLVRATRGAASR